MRNGGAAHKNIEAPRSIEISLKRVPPWRRGRPKAGIDCPEGAELCRMVKRTYGITGKRSATDEVNPATMDCASSRHCNPLPLARPFSKGLLAGDYLTWAFIPLRRIVPLRGTLSCAFGAALLQGPAQLRRITLYANPILNSYLLISAFKLSPGGGSPLDYV